MLVLDACHSGAAIIYPVPGLLRTGVHVRLEILAATRDDQTASNGCFTRSIIALLTHGSPATANEYLSAYDEHSRLREVAPPECADMPAAVHMSIRGGLDAGLWLGRNRAADLRPALRGTQDAAQVAWLTHNLVRTSYLNQLMQVRLSDRSPDRCHRPLRCREISAAVRPGTRQGGRKLRRRRVGGCTPWRHPHIRGDATRAPSVLRL